MVKERHLDENAMEDPISCSKHRLFSFQEES